MVGAAGVAGLLGGLSMRASQGSQHVRTELSLSATEAVSFRFPNSWHDTEAVDEEAQTTAAAQPEPAPARYAVASAGSIPVSLNRKPTAEAVTLKPAQEIAREPTREAAKEVVKPAEEAATMAPPWVLAAKAPLPRPRPKMAALDSSATPATTAASATAVPAAPAKQAAVAHKPKSNAVLNPAQLASIKRRLNLSPDQERYWPAVEAELRKMEYKKGPNGDTRTAAIDTTKMDVQGLRTAGFPLVMSFSDDQRRELKSLAHLLGLEGAMSGL